MFFDKSVYRDVKYLILKFADMFELKFLEALDDNIPFLPKGITIKELEFKHTCPCDAKDEFVVNLTCIKYNKTDQYMTLNLPIMTYTNFHEYYSIRNAFNYLETKKKIIVIFGDECIDSFFN